MISKLSSANQGLTLPVWVAASAIAATKVLKGTPFAGKQIIELPDRSQTVEVPVYLAFSFNEGKQAVGISYCHSGLGLDLTRDLEVWIFVQWQDEDLLALELDKPASQQCFSLIAGKGLGVFESTGIPCVSQFAYDLFEHNLRPLVPIGRRLNLELVMPAGKTLAARTSNKAFGVVNGLALIGTQAIPQKSSSPEQLQESLKNIRDQTSCSTFTGQMTFVIGENGLNLANSLGLDTQPLIKTGNWLGPLIVAAAEEGVKRLLLFGYHGKLIKLAGGIFHTHNHLADARLEILIALAVHERLPMDLIDTFAKAESIEAALLILESENREITQKLWGRMVLSVEQRSFGYLSRYGKWDMAIGAALFDRERHLRWAGPQGKHHLDFFGIKLSAEK